MTTSDTLDFPKLQAIIYTLKHLFKTAISYHFLFKLNPFSFDSIIDVFRIPLILGLLRFEGFQEPASGVLSIFGKFLILRILKRF